MTPVRPLVVLAALLAVATGISFLETACGLEVQAGYSGPYPSSTAQAALHAISGRTLIAGALGPPGIELTVRSFGVVPNPVTGKGPVLVLREPGLVLREPGPAPTPPDARQGEDGRWFLPVLTDGDAADVVWRATGETPVNFGGPTSALYRETLGLDER